MSFEARAHAVLIKVVTFGDQWLSCHVTNVYVQLMARTRQQLSMCRRCSVSIFVHVGHQRSRILVCPISPLWSFSELHQNLLLPVNQLIVVEFVVLFNH